MTDSNFMVGTAKVAVEYPEDFFPHKSFRGRYFTGVHDDLYVRAVYIVNAEAECVLFISVDAGDVSEKILPEISNRTGINQDRIFVMASHTHAAPHFGGTWEEDVIDKEQSNKYAAMYLEKIIDAAETAKGSVKKARIGIGFGTCEVNVNRDYKYKGTDGTITSPYISAPYFKGKKNRDMVAIKFMDDDDRPFACIVNYAVHSNVTFFQTWTYEEGMLVSSDLAGAAMKYVEDHSEPGMISMFSLGAAADQLPKHLANHRTFDRNGNSGWEYYGQREGFILTDVQGIEMGIAAMDTIEKTADVLNSGIIKTLRETIVCPGKEAGLGARKKAENEGAADDYKNQYKENMSSDFEYLPMGEISMDLQLIRIGRLVIAAVPAEIVTGIGERIKKVIAEKADFIPVVVTQCNGSFSYISDEEGYREMTFEAVASHFMPGIDDAIVEKFKEMIVKMNDGE